MNEELDKYFRGLMSANEKADFFTRLQADSKAQKEFARLKNTIAITEMANRKGDDEKNRKGMQELDKRISQRAQKRFRITMLKYAATACILIIGTWFITHEYTLRNQDTFYTEINVPKGQRVNMTLADGTSVWLSPRTKIRIPNEFKRHNRTVELDGEGFFSVTKDADRPFIVKTEKLNIEVLGTKFNVSAYKETSKFETCLVEGSVLVYKKDNKNEQVILNPNEKVSLMNGQMIKSASDFNNESYLESGIYSFKAKPFAEILDCLSIWYNVKFNVTDTALLTNKLSGKFRQSEDVSNILRALQGVYPFKFKKITEEQFDIY